MSSELNPKLLKPHPKNQDYYADLTSDKYAEVKRSIEAGGIRDPLWVLPDYTVIRGHQRLRIALELELERVPVEVKDVSPEEAEYLMIADNEERRQADDDPIRKAKRAKFLKEYWGVRVGNPQLAQNGLIGSGKKLGDVAAAIGEDITTTKRLLKLTALIPELQALVSAGKLGTTAAEQLAYLTPDSQQELYAAMGEAISSLSVQETKEVRAQGKEVERLQAELEKASARAIEAEEALREAQLDLADLKESLDDTIREATDEAAKKEKEKVAKLEAKIKDLTQKVKVMEQSKNDDAAKVLEFQAQLEKAKKNLLEAANHQDVRLKQKLEEVQAELKKTKTQLQTKEEEILHLTKSQILAKDRYKVHDMVSDLARMVGQQVNKIYLEVQQHNNDPDICQSVLNCVDLLIETSKTIRSWIMDKEGEIIEIDLTTPLPARKN